MHYHNEYWSVAPLSNYMDEIFLWQHQCNKMVFIDWLRKVHTEESEKEKSHLCVCHLVSLPTDMNMFPNIIHCTFQIRLYKWTNFILYSTKLNRSKWNWIVAYFFLLRNIRKGLECILGKSLNANSKNPQTVMNFNVINTMKLRKSTHLKDKADNFMYGGRSIYLHSI